MMASDVSTTVGEEVSKNDVRRQSIAGVTKTSTNGMKPRRIVKNISNTEFSSVTGCTTGNKPTTRHVSILTDRSPTKHLLRKRSSLKIVAQSFTGLLRLRRLTIQASETIKTNYKLNNTYKMSPDAGDHFAISKIKEVAQQILKDEIGSKEYSSHVTGDLACTISAKIKNKIKELNFCRYRIVCQVLITQGKEQGMEAASRCLWNASTDNYTTVTYSNDSIIAIAMMFGVYYE